MDWKCPYKEEDWDDLREECPDVEQEAAKESILSWGTGGNGELCMVQ